MENIPLDDETPDNLPVAFKSQPITSLQFVGVAIWIVGLILHLIVSGEPAATFKLILYLAVCGAEIHTLKYFVIPQVFVKNLMNWNSIHQLTLLTSFLPTDKKFQSRMVVFSKPVNMDDKANKITYQKSRIIVILFFVFINSTVDLMKTVLVGPSDFEITNKR